MHLKLDGQVLLVTGATQGVGAAVARAAAEAGVAGLVLSGRDLEKASGMADDLRRTVPQVHMIAADLAGRDAPTQLFAEALAAVGRIDGLVNAAGLTTRGGVTDGMLSDWDQLMAVNARAPFVLMQGLVRHLMARGAPGAIVNITSINAHCGAVDLAMYSASKAALVTLTRNAANAHLADCIRVNAINMGWADTPGERSMQAEVLGKGEGWLAAAGAAMPLGRLLRADEVAAQVIWLLAPQSAPQTGTVIDLEQRVIGAP